MISVIVIGKNEGERLQACLTSVQDALQGERYEVLYVDSHSSDDSLSLAFRAGARCFLPQDRKTTAALGRDIGARAAQGEWLLFLDGDMTLEKGFVQAAWEAVQNRAFSGVCGIRHDVYKKNGKTCAEDVNYFHCTAKRIAPEFGGAILLKRTALEKAGGWAVDVEAGEEAELHARLSQTGAQVVELPVPMITHTDCVQENRGIWGTVFSRRRLGYGQALRHAIETGSVLAYIRRERALFVPYVLDLLCLVLLGVMAVSAWAPALVAVALIQAAQLLFFGRIGRIRGFVSAKLFFFALPAGMACYQRRNTAYCEWTV